MKNLILLLLCSAFLRSAGSEAVDTTRAWKITGSTSLNFSQVSLTNWSEGGNGSVSGAFLFGINANNKKEKHYWDNAFNLEYGLTQNTFESARKSVDNVYLSSKYGYEIGNHWYLSSLFDFRTQMAKGFNYPNTRNYISKLMAPGYMNFALGFDYKPNDNLSLVISPLSTKLTFVRDDSLSAAGAFGVDKGKRFRAELGAYLKFLYTKKSLIKNVDFLTRLDLFSNYLKDPQNIDVNWNVKFDMKINKYLSAMIETTLKYDNDIKYIDSSGGKHGARTQLKQFLGIGLAYKF
jgi:hypothetical protein